MQKYDTVASRTLIDAEQKFLKRAENIMILGSFGDTREHPLNRTDTVVYRRIKAFQAGSNEVSVINPGTLETTEGVTPNAHTVDFVDVSVTLKQFAVLYKFSSKFQLTYEDKVVPEMADLVGDAIGLCAEMVCYGQMKAGTNVIYANGSSRSAVNSIITLDKLRAAARTLMSNLGKKVTKKIAPGGNYDTTAVESSYLVFYHTDGSSDVRDLANFNPVVKYGSSMKPAHAEEIGACEEFRFIPSPHFTPYADSGGLAATNTTKSTTGTNSDVYPFIVMAQDAVGHISLKGRGPKNGVNATILNSWQIDSNNPVGMFGFVGASIWYNSVRLNENWMTRIEAAVSALS